MGGSDGSSDIAINCHAESRRDRIRELLEALVMPYRFKRGFGACTIFANNTSEAKAYLCLTFPKLCSAADIQAANALCSPDQVISPILQPPAVAAVGGALSTLPGGPYPCSHGSMATAATNCPAYSGAIDSVIAQQQTAWQAQNAATIEIGRAHV